jgi:hypothetical protein
MLPFSFFALLYVWALYRELNILGQPKENHFGLIVGAAGMVLALFRM